jgi:hypothetical protein
MRPYLLAGLLVLLPCSTEAALAQIPYGWSDRIVHLADLPPDVRADLQKETKHSLAVGFYYRRFFLFAGGFDLWTWNGKRVLYQGDKFFEVGDGQLMMMLGKDQTENLATPLAYHFPVGLIVLVGVVAIGSVCIYFSGEARAKRMLRDLRYQQALQMYMQVLPPDWKLTHEQMQQAIAASAEYLHREHGIALEKADANVRLLLTQVYKEQSLQARQIAAGFEEAGDWPQAIAGYTQAAELQEPWDAKDHAFLLKCIARVRDKQGRATI